MKKSNSKKTGKNNILDVAVDLCSRLDNLGFSYCVIGGVAYQRWGDPRQTADVDATLFIEYGSEENVTDQLLEVFRSRIDNPQSFAVQNRIVLVESEQGTGIDISLGGLPYEQRMVARSSLWRVQGHGKIRTCSAEDLVVLKSFASRPQDWIDVEKVIIRQGNKLDRDLIREELRPLVELKEEPEILDHLEQLFSNE